MRNFQIDDFQVYIDQLSDIRWKKKRAFIIKRDKFKCLFCNSTHQLQVHHTYYISGKKAWDYKNESLITLCSLHHKTHHQLEKADPSTRLICYFGKNKQYSIFIPNKIEPKSKNKINTPKKRKQKWLSPIEKKIINLEKRRKEGLFLNDKKF